MFLEGRAGEMRALNYWRGRRAERRWAQQPPFAPAIYNLTGANREIVMPKNS
jgi:hypothetical protein